MSFGPERPHKGTTTTTFTPSRVVVLSQLTAQEKEAYYQLILTSKVKIHYDQQGQFIANVRLHGRPNSEDGRAMLSSTTMGTSDKSTADIDQRLRRLTHANGSITSSHVFTPLSTSHPLINLKVLPAESTHSSPYGHNSVQSPFNYSIYTSFTMLISDDGYVAKPRLRLLNWLMKTIEEIYDARFSQEVYKLHEHHQDSKTQPTATPHTSMNSTSPYASSGTRAREGSSPAKNSPVAKSPPVVANRVGGVGNERMGGTITASPSAPPGLSSFPAFVANRLVTTIGIRSLVDQTGEEEEEEEEEDRLASSPFVSFLPRTVHAPHALHHPTTVHLPHALHHPTTVHLPHTVQLSHTLHLLHISPSS